MRTNKLVSTWALALFSAGAVALGACSGDGDSDGSGGSGGTAGTGPGGEIGCPDDIQFFQEHVFAPILGQECIVCHSSGGLASKSKMVLSKETTGPALAANFEIVREIARTQVNGASVLLLRPTGMHPEGHTGGQLIDVGSEEYMALSAFVDRVTQGKCDGATTVSCDGPARGGRLLRRLSRSEYDATIQDLFGIPSTWGAAFGADTVVDGFDNHASALVVSPLLADQVRTASEEIADVAFGNPTSVVPCDPVAMGEAACSSLFISSFGERAFRRPLAEADSARYQALFNDVAATDGFWEAAKTVVSAMLQSPHFLYRTEVGGAAQDGVVTLTAHEIASELSYLFWGTMPDQELFDKAESGALLSQDEILKQAERLLSDPRSDATLDRFVDQWLLIANVVNVPKDNTMYPEFSAEIRAAMREETRALFRGVVRGDEPTLKALLSADKTKASPALADLYGLTGVVGPDGNVELSLAGTERIGILTQGSVLATHAHPADSSPIHRGKLVRTRILCQDLPPPPAGFNVQPPPLDPTLTTRERYLSHAVEEPCTSCHRLIDPIGFGFEKFDGIGRQRDTENGKPIDTTGEIVATPSTDGTFDGVKGLVAKLSESPDSASCFALQWQRFAYAEDFGPETACLSKELSTSFAAGGQRIDKLLLALVSARHFVERNADGGSPANPGTGGSGGGGAGGGGGTGGSGQGGGAGGGGPSGQELTVTVVQDSNWQSGYCDTVSVKNTGSSTLVWEVSLELDGTITDLWNATSTPDGSKVKFKGLEYNAVLDAGEMASFGFCAAL